MQNFLINNNFLDFLSKIFLFLMCFIASFNLTTLYADRQISYIKVNHVHIWVFELKNPNSSTPKHSGHKNIYIIFFVTQLMQGGLKLKIFYSKHSM